MNAVPLSTFEHAIRELHGCASRLIGQERVVDRFEGEVAWEGDVLVFELVGHPTADRAYAWEVDGEVTAVLGEPPVNSPRDAVRAAIMAGGVN